MMILLSLLQDPNGAEVFGSLMALLTCVGLPVLLVGLAVMVAFAVTYRLIKG